MSYEIDEGGRKYRPLSRVRDFGGISTVCVVLLGDLGSLRLSRMEGSEAQNAYVLREFETDTAKRELKTLERCQVFLLSF